MESAVDREPACEQLFDLRNDPEEVRNLMPLDGYASVKEDMRRKWEQWHERVRQ